MKNIIIGSILGVLLVYSVGSTYILINGGVYRVRSR